MTSWPADPVALPDCQQNWEALKKLFPPTVSTLPGGAVTGSRISYLSGSGVRWELVYNSSSGYWDFTGGNDIATTVSGSITTASSTYVALTSGPTITAPFAGDYVIKYNLFLQQTGVGPSNLFTSLFKNGVTDLNLVFQFSTVGQFDGVTLERTFQPVTLAAGDVLSVFVKNTNSITSVFTNAQLYLHPVRVH